MCSFVDGPLDCVGDDQMADADLLERRIEAAQVVVRRVVEGEAVKDRPRVVVDVDRMKSQHPRCQHLVRDVAVKRLRLRISEDTRQSAGAPSQRVKGEERLHQSVHIAAIRSLGRDLSLALQKTL